MKDIDFTDIIEKSGAKSLKEAIDLFKKALADDIIKVSKGITELTILSSNNDDKVYNKILKLIVMFDTGKPLVMPTIEVDTIISDTEAKPIVKPKPAIIKAGDNAFEAAINHVKAKNGAKT